MSESSGITWTAVYAAGVERWGGGKCEWGVGVDVWDVVGWGDYTKSSETQGRQEVASPSPPNPTEP